MCQKKNILVRLKSSDKAAILVRFFMKYRQTMMISGPEPELTGGIGQAEASLIYNCAGIHFIAPLRR
jgi:hypothetical protein